MPVFKKTILASSIFTLAFGAAAMAQMDYSAQIAARQGQMDIMALNVGILGNMARGNTGYDADLAQAAADNIFAAASVGHQIAWPAGSDNFDLGDATAALPAVWDDPDGFDQAWGDLRTAAAGMAEVAGTGLDAVQGAIRPLGGACGGCHRNFRQSDD
ncbi:c-type cytochrome [Nioella nitratireducens]|uniref:c-type cytochrome n=1 Tax=Nioella nitratireducens TaxID=1287720 RepID=UPI0008FD8053|nr:cytochrome c [Nioella nitratireducens]